MNYDMPDFAALRLEDFKQQIAAGIDELRDDVDRIVGNDEPATFDNTCLRLENAGRSLERAYLAFETVAGADSTPEIRAYENELAPILDGVWTDLLLDERLWHRIDAVHDGLDQIADDECRTLVERQWLARKLAGADLDQAKRERVRELRQQIARLEAEFSTKLLEDTVDAPLIVETPEQLAGLSAAEIQAAKERACDGEGYAIKLTNVTNHPLLAQLADRDTRRRLFEAQERRGGRANQWDTSQTVCEMVRLRAELAKLLGYPNHVARKVADEMAGTPEAIEERIYPLAQAARANAEREAAQLQAEADRDADERGVERFELQPWDWQYYAAKLRAREYALDEAALMDYFEYERVLIDGVFFAATKLYGITFTERPDVVAYHPDVKVFEVSTSTANRSPCSATTSIPATASAAGHGCITSSSNRASAARGPSCATRSMLPSPRPASRRCSRSMKSSRCSTSSATRCTPSCPTPDSRRCLVRTCRATSSSSPRRLTRCGLPGPR